MNWNRKLMWWLECTWTRFCLFRTRCSVGYDFKGKGTIFVRNQGSVTLGRSFRYNSGKNYNVIGGQVRLNFVVEHGAKLIIGNRVGISNSTIVCRESVSIGDDVTIGGDCRIYDTDFHSVHFEERALGRRDPGVKTAPVVIHDRVFIGASCIILKGVEIGENSVVGAGSVVTKSIPAREIWAGNPARKIRTLGTATDE